MKTQLSNWHLFLGEMNYEYLLERMYDIRPKTQLFMNCKRKREKGTHFWWKESSKNKGWPSPRHIHLGSVME